MRPKMKFRCALKKNLFTVVFVRGEMKENLFCFDLFTHTFVLIKYSHVQMFPLGVVFT